MTAKEQLELYKNLLDGSKYMQFSQPLLQRAAAREAVSEGSQQRKLAVLGSKPQQQKDPKGSSVVVVGDAMIDRYWLAADPTRISAEAPIPVCKVSAAPQFPGGAGNVAANLRAQGVSCELLSTNTPIKNRLMVGSTQLARFDENDNCMGLSKDELPKLAAANIIVVSDYDKGTITPQVKAAIRAAHNNGAMVYIDTKKDPEWYEMPTATYFPNISEWRQFRGSYAYLTSVVKKLGEDGVEVRKGSGPTRMYPAVAEKVVCVNGAGDTVIASWVAAATNSCLAGVDVGWWAMCAAAIAVEHNYTYVPTLEEIALRYQKEHQQRLW